MGRFKLQEMREIAKAIFMKSILSVDPYKRIKEYLHTDRGHLIIKEEGKSEKIFNLDEFEKIYLFGTGKASSPMAQGIEEILGDRITKGLITTKYGHGLPLKYTEVIEAGHPLPDEKGLYGAQKMRDLLRQSGPKDLILFLVSGGGSALLPFPADGITIEEKQELTQFLLACGADINEINTIRKHISHIKGGWLARWAYPSTIITFILSDVVGDYLDSIASGPTVPDPTTFQEAWEILEKYQLTQKISSSIKNYLLLGKENKVEETPKPRDKVFERVFNFIIASNFLALREAEKEAKRIGFHTLILSSSIVGETREAARFHGAIAREIVYSDHPIPRPACILSGGETTVTVRGNGLGGRNQEFCLAAAFEIEGLEQVVLLSGGTDGTDGPTDAAGAISDFTTMHRARAMGLNPKTYLLNNDSYNFFMKLGDLIITGPTRTNVMDVRILLVD
ncbi:MAG: glycerate kinase type-2 family protein [Thermodesulfobacteriota bacterium]